MNLLSKGKNQSDKVYHPYAMRGKGFKFTEKTHAVSYTGADRKELGMWWADDISSE